MGGLDHIKTLLTRLELCLKHLWCHAVDSYKSYMMKRWFLLFSGCFMYSLTTIVVVLMTYALETFDRDQKILLSVMTIAGYLVGSIYLLLYIDKIGEDKQRHPKKYF